MADVEDSGADLLWTTRNSFYVGAYQAAIADAADLEGLDEATALERDAFVFRCYVELGSHEVRLRRRRENRMESHRSIARWKKNIPLLLSRENHSLLYLIFPSLPFPLRRVGRRDLRARPSVLIMKRNEREDCVLWGEHFVPTFQHSRQRCSPSFRNLF